MCQCAIPKRRDANMPMICLLRRGGAKRLLLIVEIKQQSTISIDNGTRHKVQCTVSTDPEGVKSP